MMKAIAEYGLTLFFQKLSYFQFSNFIPEHYIHIKKAN